MKISLNWLKQYINISETPEEISKILTDCGLEVGHITNTIPNKEFIKDLMIGEVVDCQQHPNADKLKLLQVNLGENDIRQIVCGAPNVALHQKIIIAPVGATLCDNLGEKITIKSAKIRGIASEGMACSASEIGLGQEYDGIMVLKTSLSNGTKLERYLEGKDDVIIDIELTPNRGDACSHIGIARDLSAALDKDLQYPEVYDASEIVEKTLPFKINLSPAIGCYRYSGVLMHNIVVNESPEWLKERLIAIGLSPKNNIVDISNYVMHETGQPLHIYDYDLIQGNEVFVMSNLHDLSIKTLDNKDRIIKTNQLSIHDKNGPIMIPGIMGGLSTSVSLNTKNIFIESAFFDQAVIRKLSKDLDLNTDASFRFERGTGSNTIFALKRAIYLIEQIANGKVCSEIFDLKDEKLDDNKVVFFYKNLKRISGIEISSEEVKRILKRLEISIENETLESLQLSVPLFKADVVREIDVIEEILRIYGFNKISEKEFLSSSYLVPNSGCRDLSICLDLSKMLISNGFSEIRTNPITNSNYQDFLTDDQKEETVKLINPLSNVMDIMRSSLVFSGLEVILYNRNRQQSDLKIFEISKTYHVVNDAYVEKNRLSLWITGNFITDALIQSGRPVVFQDLSTQVYNILNFLGIKDFEMNDFSNSIFESGLSISKDKIDLVSLGKLKCSLIKKFDIGQKVFFADIDLEQILDLSANNTVVYKPLPKYPSIERDISLLIKDSISFEEVKKTILGLGILLIEKVKLIDIYIGKDLPESTKSYLIRLIIQSYDRTLEAAEIAKLMEKIELNLIKKLDAKIRG